MLSLRACLHLGLVALVPAGCGREADDRPAGLALFDADDVRRLAREEARPVLVSLWATWCGPCLEEMAPLSRFQSAHPEAIVLGLSTDDPAVPGRSERVRKVLDDRRPTYRQGRLDPGSEDLFLRAFGRVWDGTLPKLVLVGPDGEARLMLGQAVDDALLSRLVVPRLGPDHPATPETGAP